MTIREIANALLSRPQHRTEQELIELAINDLSDLSRLAVRDLSDIPAPRNLYYNYERQHWIELPNRQGKP